MTLSESKLSQKISDPMMDSPSYESQYLYRFHQCPKCGKPSLAHIGNKLDCIWCDFSRDLSQKEQPKKSGKSDNSFWFLLISAIIIVVVLHTN